MSKPTFGGLCAVLFKPDGRPVVERTRFRNTIPCEEHYWKKVDKEGYLSFCLFDTFADAVQFAAKCV